MAKKAGVLSVPGRVWRKASSPMRALPDFVILGTQKGGTSSFYRWMTTAPDMRPARTKELHYFDVHYDRGLLWYRSQFPIRGNFVTGEATPSLLYDDRSPERLARTLPDAKLVVFLREPATRAYSQYQHEIRRGREELSFAEALAEEPERLKTELGRRRKSYRDRGIYVDQLERWFAHVPRERFLILRSEDIFARPQEAVDEVCDWVGISRVAAGASKNTFGYTEEAPADVIAELRAFYAPHNERLAELLGDDRYLWQ